MDGERWPAALGELRQRLDGIFRAVAYRDAVGADLADWGLGWSAVTARPTAALANLAGGVHGGVLAGLADLAFEVACNSYGRLCVATGLAVHYAAAAQVGAPLRAAAAEVSRSRRVASYQVTVTADDQVVAWCQATAYRTDTWHGGPDGYPEQWRRRY
jgi:acyl-CoA thioesterase